MNLVSKPVHNKEELLSKSLKFFFFYVLMYISIGYLSSRFVYTDDFYLNSWGNQIAANRIAELIYQQRRLAWIGYLFVPVFVFFKILLPAICLYIYSMLYDLHIKWKNCLAITLQAEAILLIPGVLRFGWFLFFPPENFESISNFSPWSLLFLANDETAGYFKYILQTINIFEILYWIALAVGIKSALNCSFKNSLSIVAKSYGIGLLTWVALVCFFLIQIS